MKRRDSLLKSRDTIILNSDSLHQLMKPQNDSLKYDKTQMKEMESIYDILRQPGQERTEEALRVLHGYFMRENLFMRRIMKEKGEYDTFRIYRALEMKIYDHNSKICEIGQPGNNFYIIIRGEVGVLSPCIHDDYY